ncbi:MAG: response regulator transcription factor [Vicinamibacterales bacterium]
MTTTSNESRRRALVVEDEPHIRDLVALHLDLDGWDVETAVDGDEGLTRARTSPFDLVVLDVMLPRLDGMTVLKALRRDARTADLPVLMLTARREENDKVLGLESGADDYLTKPFGVRELVARARALTRRPRTAPAATARTVDDADAPPAPRAVTLRNVVVDPARRKVTVDGRVVDFTGREFEVLYLLASHPGIVFSRDALVQRVWKGDTFVTERNVDTLIKRVRKKIESRAASPELILTVWGAGYKAVEPS